jgi:hypothetical protein
MHLKVEKKNFKKKFQKLFILIYATYSLFPDIPRQLNKFSDECHKFSFDVVFLPIQSLLNGFSKLKVNEIKISFCLI